MKPTLTHMIQDALIGLVGMAAPLLAAVHSWQEQMEWGMRMLALAAGMAVSVVTIITLRKRNP